MNAFRGKLQGKSGEKATITTQGNKLNMACSSHRIGADVDIFHNVKKKRDEVRIYITHRSAKGNDCLALGTFFINEKGQIRGG